LQEQAFGWVAQLVEQGTENPRVRGSTPFPATSKRAGQGTSCSGLFSYVRDGVCFSCTPKTKKQAGRKHPTCSPN
jgi:hypothetical protein